MRRPRQQIRHLRRCRFARICGDELRDDARCALLRQIRRKHRALKQHSYAHHYGNHRCSQHLFQRPRRRREASLSGLDACASWEPLRPDLSYQIGRPLLGGRNTRFATRAARGLFGHGFVYSLIGRSSRLRAARRALGLCSRLFGGSFARGVYRRHVSGGRSLGICLARTAATLLGSFGGRFSRLGSGLIGLFRATSAGLLRRSFTRGTIGRRRGRGGRRECGGQLGDHLVGDHALATFSQSFRKDSRPRSVSGC